MNLTLTPFENEMLAGKHGAGTKMAMSIIVRMARFLKAPRLIEISQAHIDSSVYLGAAGLEFAERLAASGAKVTVPSTLNVSSVDEHHWQEWSVPPTWAAEARRQMVAFEQMGCTPTWTCAPYQESAVPAFGEQVAWGESSAIVFANSVLGARTSRYPDLMDICAAITGRVPEAGLHLTENRAATLQLNLIDVPEALQKHDTFYPVLGHLLGKYAANDVPVIDGLKVRPNQDQLKALGAASASSGAVALYHIVGVTPEAPTLAEACQNQTPKQIIDIDMPLLREAYRDLTHASDGELDLVILGSPHFSLTEFQRLAPLVEGRQCHPKVKFVITSSRAMALLAQKTGALAPIKKFGAQITLDTCILVSPMLPASIKRLMTNSAKYAYYAPGLLETDITFGSLEDCVASAVAGRIERDESLWE